MESWSDLLLVALFYLLVVTLFGDLLWTLIDLLLVSLFDFLSWLPPASACDGPPRATSERI